MKYRTALSVRLLLAACPLALLLAAGTAQAQDPQFSQAPVVEQSRVAGDEDAAAEMRDAFVLQPGFQVELLFTVPRDQIGFMGLPGARR